MRNKGEATLLLVKDALIEENKERLNAHVEVLSFDESKITYSNNFLLVVKNKYGINIISFLKYQLIVVKLFCDNGINFGVMMNMIILSIQVTSYSNFMADHNYDIKPSKLKNASQIKN